MASQEHRRAAHYPLPCSLELTCSEALESTFSETRDRERHIRCSLTPPAEEQVLRTIVAGDVSSAQGMICDPGISAEEFRNGCLSLRGEPWSEATRRRDMRERVRVWHRMLERGAQVPGTPEELIALWSEAGEGEFPIYREAKTAGFRLEGTPFAHGPIPFEAKPLPPGAQTAAPEDIPAEVERLLALIGCPDLPLELRGAVAYFSHVVIHPFRDGNGRCGRMLACTVLSAEYSLPSLVAYTRRLQGGRLETGELIRAAVREQGDAERACLFLAGLLLEAQQDVLAMLEGKPA